ncbi:hypothetical protein BDB00DRAFT_870534 [Zychaea mexicana]|uniref:uncharacterized protein n=1 Tax=Zychaea mexicana TaxID=64656 RepID=UPI0022FEF948|nr:uncharacterized protein BDB00DRAFT_870534 [Zychaea mexicana]KAI9495386.1 hypothetical protein BDB00DRAFT_870534 [Zychaea mexicana]
MINDALSKRQRRLPSTRLSCGGYRYINPTITIGNSATTIKLIAIYLTSHQTTKFNLRRQMVVKEKLDNKSRESRRTRPWRRHIGFGGPYVRLQLPGASKRATLNATNNGLTQSVPIWSTISDGAPPFNIGYSKNPSDWLHHVKAHSQATSDEETRKLSSTHGTTILVSHHHQSTPQQNAWKSLSTWLPTTYDSMAAATSGSNYQALEQQHAQPYKRLARFRKYYLSTHGKI